MICKPVWGTQHSAFRLRFLFLTLQQYRHFIRTFPSILFLPPSSSFAGIFCLAAMTSSPFFAAFASLLRNISFFSLALPFPAPLMFHLSVFLFSTFVGSRFRLSAPSSVPFPPQKKLRPGRQSRAVLLPESNVHSFASDGESPQTKPQAMQFTSGAELFRQFCFSKTAAKPAA